MPRRERRVRRVVRRVEPWSVLRFSLLFYLCVFAIVLTASVVLWYGARSVGALDNVEDFIGDLAALDDFRFAGGKLLRGMALGGVVLVALGSAANMLAAVLYNLIADVVGGIEVGLADEER